MVSFLVWMVVRFVVKLLAVWQGLVPGPDVSFFIFKSELKSKDLTQ